MVPNGWPVVSADPENFEHCSTCLIYVLPSNSHHNHLRKGFHYHDFIAGDFNFIVALEFENITVLPYDVIPAAGADLAAFQSIGIGMTMAATKRATRIMLYWMPWDTETWSASS